MSRGAAPVPSLGWAAAGTYCLVMRLFAFVVLAFHLVIGAPFGAADARQDDARLDGLFARLHGTTDPQEALAVQAMIWAVWFESGNEEIDRLLAQGNDAMSAGAYDVALLQFNEAVEKDPDLAEAWNRRATLFFLMGDYEASIRDIDKTLALEPRHFGALSGLGLVNIRLERFQAALEAFHRALDANPHAVGAQKNIRALEKQIGGEDI